MTDELPEPRRILEETDWAGLQNRDGAAYPVTPAMLRNLTSGDQQAVSAALGHLSRELMEYPNVYSAAVPAARYVTALLALLTPEKTLRAQLLSWLSSLVDAVSDAMALEFFELAGFSPLENPDSTFRKIREIRPQIFAGVAACIDDQDPVVREEAIAAAVVIVEAPELASHRQALTPLVKEVLAVSSKPAYRQRASAALEAWG
ncbi:hypothetical protein HH310_34890 [Actinoplanes sp. TBRC 11911]|uniref:hypothetical protein n=1 Tax=Actinoplanes sp. TBRC 11911 TaxID=2729386 RepID=UPI00145F5EF7|nr:hypothetical protein [Actinoplanes sp. TBRC 11911]NMO56351.1 hypothetical protein [Actinoplanes sp. TBRC 11911]